MTFKEQLENDLNTFINSAEFADTHTINGVSLQAVVHGLKTSDVITKQAKHTVDFEGVSGRTVVVHFKTADMTEPIASENVVELDGEMYRVADTSEDCGMTRLTLEVDFL